MYRFFIFLGILLIASVPGHSQDIPPVRGLCIASPEKGHLSEFIDFMDNVLGPGNINTLVLRVDYNYAYRSHPELQNENPLEFNDVKQLVRAAGKLDIRLIPQINLLGHQSWHTSMGKLLEVYPEFDENPSVKLPESYEWPNEDGLYCKSYCPQHPQVHEVVFALVDEILEVFETDAFHAGLDEVFYIGEEECPRCSGMDKAKLFADEVERIRAHLESRGAELWIWGDRMLEGKESGLGMWEASENGTHESIDLINRQVVVCDWHYERADPTAALFAMRGYRVITCPWNRPEVTRQQLKMLDMFRRNSPPGRKDQYYGFMQTVWSPAERFIRDYYSGAGQETPGEKSHTASFRLMMEHYR